ncbi:carbon-nitrogen hydrolase family protein [Kineosporia babensis]|uniref:Carbon-nitrogen hydrolase family protein n=1 Tax=Kineosporia babensis TaxID=499548 RepID=A0A9X1NG74_9ACTN|nr:carbon-nitrogen hydrolase family protein [Kineosporia babensis]MCD5312468.1 carbon-nitrogen hydrolase family protein [Kineosporia babensis]
MSAITLGVVSAPFDRDLEADFARIATLIQQARELGVNLLALPEATLGGYLSDLRGSAPPPPAFRQDGPEIARLAELAADMVVCAGYCELADDGSLYNSVVCVHDGRVLGNHRKVHQPLREDAHYTAGESFTAFDTPVGRIGMMICYDKAFPESARSLALDGAQIVVCVSAWPGSRTNAPENIEDDRWKHRFDLFDAARALENQIVWLSANQSGHFGSLRFVASAKIVGPGGDVLAGTGVGEGLAVAKVDVEETLTAARRAMGHLRDRRPAAYLVGAEG